MKKIISLVIVLSLLLGLASIASAAVKKAAVKKKVVKKAVKKAAPKVVAPRLEVAPPPPPVIRPIAAAPAAAGMEIGGSVGYLTKYGTGDQLGVVGFIQIADPLGLGPMLGLGANDVAYRLGGIYATGKSGDGAKDASAGLVYADGILNLPKDLAMGVETYIGGGLNYAVKRTGSSGGLGGEVYAGAQADLLGIGGKQFIEAGYTVIKGDAAYTTNKGVGVMVGAKIPTSMLGF